MKPEVRAKIFWSGGSQAVRMPKELRFPGEEVVVRRRGKTVVLEPVPEGDDWAGFWDRLLVLDAPVRRWKTKKSETRRGV